MKFTPETRASYAKSWASMKVTPSRIPQLVKIVESFIAHQDKYKAVEKEIKVPWWFIAPIHKRESDCDFATYLGNGDPLNRVTRHVPKGRGLFPDWSAGAIDALKLEGLDKWTDWSIEGALYQIEAYNGWGYLGKCNSPYVWSWSNLYASGKYVADGEFSASAVDQQPGCAPMIWQMIQMQLIPELSGQHK